MAGAVPTLYWFDRFEERIGVLHAAGELVHAEEVNGDDEISFESREAPAKGDRIVWHDGDRWREHIVVSTEEPPRGPCAVRAESSICELEGDFLEDRRVVERMAKDALSIVLEGTRWSIGDVYAAGPESCLLYRMSALEALRKVAGVFDCQFEPVITVAGGRVTGRAVDMPKALGRDRGLRLTYGRNMTGCARRVLADAVVTAMYGYGRGVPATDEDGQLTGGYGRRLTFGSVNGGKNYVEDNAARLRYGRWNAERTAKVHVFGKVIFPGVDDPDELMGRTMIALRRAKKPKVVYEVDMAALDGGDDAALGDTVRVIDLTRDPEWRVKARVHRRVRTFGDCVTARLEISDEMKETYTPVVAGGGVV